MNLTFIDVETTGLSTSKHEIIDVWTRRVRADTLELVDEGGGRVRPEHLEAADPEALAVNGYSAERWKDARPFAEVWDEIKPLFVGEIVVGHNVGFDIRFLTAACSRIGAYPWPRLPVPAIDTKGLARELVQRGQARSAKLDDLVEDLRLEVDGAEAHTARGDVLRTIELYRRLKNH